MRLAPIFSLKCFTFIVLTIATAALGQHQITNPDEAGYPFDIPRHRVALPDRAPVVDFPLSNIDAETQTYVNYALELSHGFWTYEAERNLREAIARQPAHPMPYVLAAFVQYIFMSGDFERGKNYLSQAQKARTEYTLALSEREQLWFDAIDALYDPALEKNKDRKRFQNHIDQLTNIVTKFPEDREAKAYLALGIWYYLIASDKIPEGEKPALSRKADRLIEDVLAAAPKHPAHHYKIHLWNNGTDDFRALESARACGPAQPQTAHLWHMPAHIFTVTGDYHFAWWQVEVAHRVDNKHISARRLMPTNIHNYYHNYMDYLVSLKLIIGQPRETLLHGRKLLEFGRLPHMISIFGSQKLASRLLEVMEKYGLYSELLQMDEQGYFANQGGGIPEFSQKYTAQIMRLKVRAYSASGEHEKAATVLTELWKYQNEIFATADAAVAAAISKQYEDAKLWYEISLRPGTLRVPLVLLEKLEALEVSPREQVLIAALNNHYEEWVVAKLKEKYGTKLPTEVFRLMDLLYIVETLRLESFDLKGYRELLSERIERTLVTPFSENDFSGMALSRTYPGLLKQLMENATRYSATRFENLNAEFSYVDWERLPEFGPADPQFSIFPDYAGTDREGLDFFARPTPGRLKLFAFVPGPGCEQCNLLVRKLIKQKEEFAKLNIDLGFVTPNTEDFSLPTYNDPEFAQFKAFDVWDQFAERPLHGIFLVNENGRMLWHSISEHALPDVDFLRAEAARLRKLF